MYTYIHVPGGQDGVIRAEIVLVNESMSSRRDVSNGMSSDSAHCPVLLRMLGFPGGAVVENLPANAGDTGSSPGLGRCHMPQSS